ncbi:hypothetical protein [Xanthobacter autotrophicus]|uniref:hypothetical protein n=1 Tax=Xanthobacter autotrophicus TaxID=280 RepID=UPI0037279B95
MKDTERELADCVGAIYQAGAGDGSWFDVGERICRIMDARRALLNLGGPGGPRNLLMPADGSETAYSDYFHPMPRRPAMTLRQREPTTSATRSSAPSWSPKPNSCAANITSTSLGITSVAT